MLYHQSDEMGYLAFMCPSSCFETNYVLSTHLTI